MKARISFNLLMSMTLLLLFSACEFSPSSAGQPSQVSERRQEMNAQEIKLYPVDEGTSDESFAAFRSRLLEASRNHDKDFILSILDPHILNSFGGSGGIEEFREQWELNQPSSELWDTLITILSLGGSFESNESGRQFCAPYVSSRWRSIVSQLPSPSDSLEYAAIVSQNIEVRREPNLTSPVVTTLSYDVVKVDYEASVPDEARSNSFTWVKITTMNGVQGYVSSRSVRSPSDYRACFRKVGERWVMTMLVAGD